MMKIKPMKVNLSHFMLLISIGLLLYIFFVIIPIGITTSHPMLLYFFLNIPILFAYAVFIHKKIGEIKYFATLIYPLASINLVIGFPMCLALIDDAAPWMIVVVAPIFALFLIVITIAGIVKDFLYAWKGKQKQT
ncbi:MAG: hypothetical protein FWC69_04840 [Defluviitaleaceae bacterium]|nr:hypothetical protein [Defluviitaleaceae bacterium]